MTLCALLWAAEAAAECRLALALGLDVSGSVDAREYRLQLDGLAGALTHPQVVQAFLASPNEHVALSVYEWSGADAHRGVLDWTRITDRAVLDQVADRLRATTRTQMPLTTALGEAKRHGSRLLLPLSECRRRVLDLSGDGTSNSGARPQDVIPHDATVNALVIAEPVSPDQTASGDRALEAYFRAYVIEGADSFVETAKGFEDFEAAMVRKLLREMQVVVIGAELPRNLPPRTTQ